MGKETELTKAMWKSMGALHDAGGTYDDFGSTRCECA